MPPIDFKKLNVMVHMGPMIKKVRSRDMSYERKRFWSFSCDIDVRGYDFSEKIHRTTQKRLLAAYERLSIAQ